MPNPTNNAPQKILISRVDNIGDVILTLPLVPLLKKQFPHSQVLFLARDYVRGIIEAYPMIDGFLSWEQFSSKPEAEAVADLRNLNFDTIIHVSPKKEIAKLAAKAKIKQRIGTSHRWYHYFYCTQLIAFNRSKSTLHEAQLNLKLLAPFGIKETLSLQQLIPFTMLCPQLKPLPHNIDNLIDPARFNLILHPFSNGHAKEWPLEYYQQLIHALPAEQFNIFITGSAQEAVALKPLIEQCPQAHAVCGQLNLSELLILIARCNGLIASSTGPLHMAAAVGIKALGLFPPPQTMNPTRWQPVGKQAEYLVTQSSAVPANSRDGGLSGGRSAILPPAQSSCVTRCLYPEGRSCQCLRAIDVDKVMKVLERWLQ